MLATPTVSLTALQTSAIYIVLTCPPSDWPAALERLGKNHEMVAAFFGPESADMQTYEIGLEFRRLLSDQIESKKLLEAVFNKDHWEITPPDEDPSDE